MVTPERGLFYITQMECWSKGVLEYWVNLKIPAAISTFIPLSFGMPNRSSALFSILQYSTTPLLLLIPNSAEPSVSDLVLRARVSILD